MSIILQGSTSGSITLQEPAVAGTNTVTIPARTGNIMLDGPAFSVYQSTGQVLSSGTTVVSLDSKEFDTNNNYNTSTNRFTPTVAGYYFVTGCINAAFGAGESSAQIAKNGTFFKILADTQNQSLYVVGGSALIYMNGTTDYLDLRCYIATGTTLTAGSTRTYFQGFLVRGA